MEHQEKIPLSTESFSRIISAQFPEISEITGEIFWMTIHISEDLRNPSPFIKSLHGFLKNFLELHGDPDEEYQFTIQRGRELIDILHFNDEDAAYHITMELLGQVQRLRIQDVLGATGDYTIFNEEFERLGTLSTVAPQPEQHPDGSLVNPDDMDDFSDEVYPDFSNANIWQIEPAVLQPYINQIREKVLEEINRNYQPMEIDLDDAEDVSFWTEQFQISEADLRKAVLAAGKSIDDITTYLQK